MKCIGKGKIGHSEFEIEVSVATTARRSKAAGS
jgi:hypothetical protein